MKKLIILSIAMMSFGAVFSQQRNDMGRRPDYNQSKNTRHISNDNSSYSNDHGYNNNNNQGNRYDDRYDNRNHRADIDRVNREYDQRINGYRNDRSINSYERDRRIRQAEYERTQKVNSFTTGVAVGALATVILGAIFSR
jgi:hypothetical protein